MYIPIYGPVHMDPGDATLERFAPEIEPTFKMNSLPTSRRMKLLRYPLVTEFIWRRRLPESKGVILRYQYRGYTPFCKVLKHML